MGYRPIILTLHDLLSRVISQPWLRKKVLARELEACRRVSGVVCVSESDRSELASHGITAMVVPHGLDLSRRHADDIPAGRADLTCMQQHHSEGGFVCFFIGSSLEPNRQAVEAISEMAFRLEGEKQILFVVAGACCGASRPGRNIICLGPVSQSELDFLYAHTDVALAPVPSGTGTSTKVLEAMSRGKALLGTSAALRGLKVVAGSDCLICDNLAQYPGLLLELVRDPQQLRDLGSRAQEFARGYDFRIIYQPYLDMLDGMTIKAGLRRAT